MIEQRQAIVIEELLPHSPDRVWRALTDPRRLAKWFMPNDFAPRVGHRFALDSGMWGTTSCRVLEIRPEQLIRYSWRNGALDTEVTWQLQAEGTGTRLRLVHSGFDLRDPANRFAYRNMGDGWRSIVLRALGMHLDEGVSR